MLIPDEMTIALRHSLGAFCSAGVGMAIFRSMMMDVTILLNGVCAPPALLLMALQLKLPVIGYAEKKEPTILVVPRATNSWFGTSS